MDTGYDVFFRNVLRQQGNDFRFCKDGAGAADSSRMLRFEVPIPHFRHGDFQYLGHDVEETARTGSAFIVHGKLHDQSLTVELNRFDILAADIENRRRARAFKESAFSMAGNFTDFAFGTVDVEAAVAGGNDIGHIFYL